MYNVPPDGLLQSFLQNGVISGIGSVIIFLPQILILFLFILLLEDLGYMARAAFLMDRIMGSAGLHGRAFIPLLSSFACAIPGIMATRVIDNTRAKFFFWRDDPTPPFMLELPDYKLPRPRSIIIGVLMRAKMFLQRAGTTIFSMMALIWFLASFPRPPAGAQGPDINYSLAAMIGRALQPVLAPVGFNWQINVTLIQGMAAREVAVAALGTVYANQGGKEAVEQIGHVLASKLSLATALSIPVWYIFAPQCASTLAVIKRETGSWRWMAVTFGYMLALAYVASLITYNVAVALGAG